MSPSSRGPTGGVPSAAPRAELGARELCSGCGGPGGKAGEAEPRPRPVPRSPRGRAVSARRRGGGGGWGGGGPLLGGSGSAPAPSLAFGQLRSGSSARVRGPGRRAGDTWAGTGRRGGGAARSPGGAAGAGRAVPAGAPGAAARPAGSRRRRGLGWRGARRGWGPGSPGTGDGEGARRPAAAGRAGARCCGRGRPPVGPACGRGQVRKGVRLPFPVRDPIVSVARGPGRLRNTCRRPRWARRGVSLSFFVRRVRGPLRLLLRPLRRRPRTSQRPGVQTRRAPAPRTPRVPRK